MCVEVTVCVHACMCVCLVVVIKRISRELIYCTRWEHRVLYNNNTHTHWHVRRGIGMAVKNSLEIVIEQVHLEGGFKRRPNQSV